MIENINMTKSDIGTLLDEKQTVHISSNFSFLASHFGLRPKAMHMLLAPSHAGKTTLTLSLIKSLTQDVINIRKKLKIACYWSEESTKDIAVHLSSMRMYGELIKRIDMISEIDTTTTEKDLFDYLEIISPDVFIFDNITTSKFYNDKNAKDQGTFLIKLKEISKKNNIALFIIAHTDKNVSMNLNRMICKEDIRGSKNAPNLAEFFYILQPIEVGNIKSVFLKIEKHRGYDVEQRLYKLEYSEKTRTINRDIPVNFELFKELFNKRNTLVKTR